MRQKEEVYYEIKRGLYETYLQNTWDLYRLTKYRGGHSSCGVEERKEKRLSNELVIVDLLFDYHIRSEQISLSH